MLKSQSRCQPSLNDSHENLRYRLPQSFIHGMRTICSELCRFLVAMILSSLPPHNAPGPTRLGSLVERRFVGCGSLVERHHRLPAPKPTAAPWSASCLGWPRSPRSPRSSRCIGPTAPCQVDPVLDFP